MKKNILLFICCLLVCTVSCNHNDTNDIKIINTNEYFSVKKIGAEFYCEIHNKSNDTTVLGPTYRQPDVSIIDSNIVKYSTQAGTGKSTQSTVYYDTTNGGCSRVFCSVFDETDTMVAYLSGVNQITVQNIFDNQHTKTLTSSDFDEEISQVIEPFISVVFSDDKKFIVVKYLSGTNYVVKEKSFNIEA